MREVDEEHMLIHRDNSEERGRAASPLVTGTVDEAQSECQMAVIWGSLSPLSASRGTSTLTSITTTCTSCFWSDNGALPAWPLGFHGEQHRASCTVSLILLPTPIREERVHYIWTNLWSNTAITKFFQSNLQPWVFTVDISILWGRFKIASLRIFCLSENEFTHLFLSSCIHSQLHYMPPHKVQLNFKAQNMHDRISYSTMTFSATPILCTKHPKTGEDLSVQKDQDLHFLAAAHIMFYHSCCSPLWPPAQPIHCAFLLAVQPTPNHISLEVSNMQCKFSLFDSHVSVDLPEKY